MVKWLSLLKWLLCCNDFIQGWSTIIFITFCLLVNFATGVQSYSRSALGWRRDHEGFLPLRILWSELTLKMLFTWEVQKSDIKIMALRVESMLKM